MYFWRSNWRFAVTAETTSNSTNWGSPVGSYTKVRVQVYEHCVLPTRMTSSIQFEDSFYGWNSGVFEAVSSKNGFYFVLKS